MDKPLSKIVLFLLWTALFAVAYTQAPLYYSNQNQYCLHGLADGGLGYLQDDWLAGTQDPTPAFSALVAFTNRHLHEGFFHVYYALLMGVYLWSLLGIVERVVVPDAGPAFRCLFLGVFVLLHSALLRWLSCQALGLDYPWYFQAGLAGQYVLGPVFQPSAIGVLLILSIYLYVSDRPCLAGVAAALCATLHSTYLLGAAVLTVAYMLGLAREKRFKEALSVGALALALVLPTVIYILRVFSPTAPDLFAEAQKLLVELRIPHHAKVSRWLDVVAMAQIAGILAAACLLRGTRLCGVFVVSIVLSLTLTILQQATQSDMLALLFPWRTSTFLVPIATAVLLGRLLASAAPRVPKTAQFATGGLLTAAAAAGGLAFLLMEIGYRRNPEELPLFDHVRQRLKKGDTYLVPIELPKPPAQPGAFSSDFLTPNAVKKVTVIPPDLQRFRLHTGAPIFVDYKSIPYRDDELLEWHRRVFAARDLYEKLAAGRFAEVREELERHRLTHIVTSASRPPAWDELEIVYQDAAYHVYRWRSQAP